MTTMALSGSQRFGIVLNQVTSLLNASTTYGTNDDTKRHPDQEIKDQIMLADQYILGSFLAIPGHARRNDYIVATPVIYGAQIPSHLGPIGDILVDSQQPAYLDATEIRILRASTTLFYQGPYFDVVGERLFFTGTAATVDLVIPKESGTDLLSPPEYQNAVIATALAFLFAKEGADIQAAEHFKSIMDSTIELVKMGAESIPQVTAYEKSA